MADPTEQILHSSYSIDPTPYHDWHFNSLREQAYKISEILANDLQISVTDAELSSLFSRKGTRSHGMSFDYLHQLSTAHVLHPGRSPLVPENLKT
jgi:hypothetical protein